MPESTNLFPILFVIVAAVIVVAMVVIVISIVSNARKARAAGHNPFTLQTELATKLLDSGALSRERPTEERLAELDRLHSQRVITEDEYRTARAKVLAG